MKYLASFLLILPLLFAGCKKGGPTEAESHNVIYQFDGTAETAFFTYLTSQGKYEQESSASSPWADTSVYYSGDKVYISAQNLTPSGIVRVRIIVDGYLFKNTWSEGPYAIAIAEGTLE